MIKKKKYQKNSTLLSEFTNQESESEELVIGNQQ
jgi:hypothetical protein